MKTGDTGDVPTRDYWLIGEKTIALHRAGKADGNMAYKADASGYPMTIDLTPDRGPAKGKVTALVDRKVWLGDPRDIPLKAHAQIQLEVGTPLVAPVRISNWSGL